MQCSKCLKKAIGTIFDPQEGKLVAVCDTCYELIMDLRKDLAEEG